VNPIAVAVAVTVLVACTALILRWARVPIAASAVIAVLRGAAQLAVVSLLLGLALSRDWAAAIVLAVMLGTAILTARSRVRDFPRALPAMAAAITGGALLTLGVVFLSGAFDLEPRYLIAFAGIVIGGSMTAAATAGRQLWLGLLHRSDEVEGWLALGATPRQAVADLARSAVAEALRPSIDQTKTTGLVTLPGAFVGALLAGASPVDAGVFQVTVLAGLLAAGSLSSTLTVYLLGAPRTLPAR
jgi:putative ABC transport system permease protein